MARRSPRPSPGQLILAAAQASPRAATTCTARPGEFAATLRATDNFDYTSRSQAIRSDSPRVCARGESLADISRLVSAYIANNDLGSGHFPETLVTDSMGRAVARISYNGRAWPNVPWHPDLVPLPLEAMPFDAPGAREGFRLLSERAQSRR